MLSNVFESEKLQEDVDLFELNEDECKPLIINDLCADDLTLFCKTFQECIDIEDISLWYWTILKVMRIMVDFKLRLKGIDSKKDIDLELRILFPNEEEYKVVNDLKIHITNICKDKRTNVLSIFGAISSLNDFCKKLNFEQIIKDDDISKVKDKLKNQMDKEVIKNPKPKNLFFRILKSGHDVVFADKLDTSKRAYIMHTRYQITDSLTSFTLQKDND